MEEWSLVAFSCRNVISCRVPSLSVFKASLFFKFGSMLFMPSKTDAVLQCCAAAALRNMICHRLQLTGCLSKPDHLWGLLWHLGDEGEPENMAEAAQRVSCNFGSNYRNWRVLEGLCSFLASWLTTVFLFFCFFLQVLKHCLVVEGASQIEAWGICGQTQRISFDSQHRHS